LFQQNATFYVVRNTPGGSPIQNYSISYQSYGANTNWAHYLNEANPSYKISMTFAHQYYFGISVPVNKAFTITISAAVTTSQSFFLVRRQDCLNIAVGSLGNLTNDIIISNYSLLSDDGFYVLRISGPSSPVNLTVSLKTGSAACYKIAGALSFCNVDNNGATLIDTTNYLYGTDFYQSFLTDIQAGFGYASTVLFLANNGTANCLNEIKKFTCHLLFPACDSNGATTPHCGSSCAGAIAACGENQCLLDTCIQTTTSICGAYQMTVPMTILIVSLLSFFLL